MCSPELPLERSFATGCHNPHQTTQVAPRVFHGAAENLAVDASTIASKLNDILSQIAAQSSAHIKAGGSIDPTVEFSMLGVNSVDLMEFILRVEKEFRIDVLGEMLPDDLPTNLDGWAKLVQSRLERSARST